MFSLRVSSVSKFERAIESRSLVIKFSNSSFPLCSFLQSFQCRHGKAYLFNKVVNVTSGANEDRHMMTGVHTVADIFCVCCGSIVGWKYETAHDKSQKYKEGKSVLERSVDNSSEPLNINVQSNYELRLLVGTKHVPQYQSHVTSHERLYYLNAFFSLNRFKISGPDGSSYWTSRETRAPSDTEDV
nr:protein yippee-like [Ipomoea batatas]